MKLILKKLETNATKANWFVKNKIIQWSNFT